MGDRQADQALAADLKSPGDCHIQEQGLDHQAQHLLTVAIEDMHHSASGELCALARVNMSGSREPSRSSNDDFPGASETSPPTGGSGSCERPAGAYLR